MLGLQLQCYSYMERVERSDTEPWQTISSQHNARVKYPLREPYFNPHTGFAITLELPVNRLRFPCCDPVLKYVLANCMCPFSAMQRRQPDTRMLRHVLLCFPGMGIR